MKHTPVNESTEEINLEKLFYAVYAKSNAGIAIFDSNLEILDYNNKFIDVMNILRRSMTIGNNLADIFEDCFGITDPDEISNLINTHNDPIYKSKKLDDGSKLHLLFDFVELHNSIYMLKISNITKIKDAEEIIIDKSRLASVGETLTMLIHQWRQPLAIISSLSVGTRMKIEMSEGDNINEYLKSQMTSIDKTISFMNDTLETFMSFFRVNEKTITDINILVENSIKLFNLTHATTNIKVNTHFNLDNKVDVYPNELIQVFMNFVSNSLYAFEDNNIKSPEIDIQTFHLDGKTYITFTDNAGGIPDDVIGHIFDVNYSSKGVDGNGLGLYMSKIIIEEHHHGELTVEKIENGSKFIIIL